MSILELIPSFSTCCRVPGCRWLGRFRDLEQHFNKFHPHLILKMKSTSYFVLTLDDLESREPFLLVTQRGIYWFTLNEREKRPELFSKGIFAIGESEKLQYYIKLGTFATRITEILGPFETHEEKSNKYDLSMEFDYIKCLKDTMTPKVVIYFGDFEEYDDEHDEITELTPKEITESLPTEYKYTNFVCSDCVKLNAGDPIYCSNGDYLCTKCYERKLLCIKPKLDSKIYVIK